MQFYPILQIVLQTLNKKRMPKGHEHIFWAASKRFRICFFLFFMSQIIFHFSYSQVKDTVRISDSVRFHLAITSTGSLNQSEKSSTYLMNNAFRLNATHRLFSVNAFGSYVYGLSGHSLTNNDMIASVDGNYYLHPSKFFLWILVNYTSSYSLQIKGLFQSGAGVAYDFIKTKDNRLNISDGIIYEKDNLYIDTAFDIYSTFRNSFRLAFKWTIINKVVFEGSNFLQNSLSDKDDYIIRSNLALIINLNKWLSLTSSFIYNRFNRTGRQNLLLTYGLRIEKDF
jgi:hypothetical protein